MQSNAAAVQRAPRPGSEYRAAEQARGEFEVREAEAGRGRDGDRTPQGVAGRGGQHQKKITDFCKVRSLYVLLQKKIWFVCSRSAQLQ